MKCFGSNCGTSGDISHAEYYKLPYFCSCRKVGAVQTGDNAKKTNFFHQVGKQARLVWNLCSEDAWLHNCWTRAHPHGFHVSMKPSPPKNPTKKPNNNKKQSPQPNSSLIFKAAVQWRLVTSNLFYFPPFLRPYWTLITGFMLAYWNLLLISTGPVWALRITSPGYSIAIKQIWIESQH